MTECARPVVLVVEDEPLLRISAVDMVEEAGFAALGVVDAAAALHVLERRSGIRVVFSDIEMPPGMDGTALAAVIRERWPPIAVVLTSGKHRPATEDLPERGFFMPKPYGHQDVAAAMSRCLA